MQKLLILLTVLAVSLPPSKAGAYVACQGVVQSMEIRPTGEFAADHGYGHRIICNVSGGNTACQAIYAQFLGAWNQRQKITSHHQASTTCAQAFAPATLEPAYAYTTQP